MPDTPPNLFSVADDPWIPVIRQGEPVLVSARELLVDAHRLDAFDLGRPLSVTPLIRLLVAMLQRAAPIQTEAELRRAWQRGNLEASAVNRFFDETADRFRLFDSERPFMQVPNLASGAGAEKTAAVLDLATPSGNNVPLFGNRTDGDPPQLSPADAVLGMLVANGMDTGGVRTGVANDPRTFQGKSSNPIGMLGSLGLVVPLGRTVFETLLLNVPLVAIPRDDRTVWERDLTPVWESAARIHGPLDLLTWSSRRMRLVLTPDGQSVDRVVIASGDRHDFIPPQWEPHTRWTRTKPGSKVSARPMPWPPGRQSWRGLESLIAVHGDATRPGTSILLRQIDRLRDLIGSDYPLDILCLGVTYGKNAGTVEDVFVDVLPLPVLALDEDGVVADALLSICTAASAVRDALNSLHTNIRRACGADAIDWKVGIHPGDDAMVLLDAPTRRLLSGLRREPHRYDEGVNAWVKSVRAIAWSVANDLLDGAPLQAHRGRTHEVKGKLRTISIHDAEGLFRAALTKALAGATTPQENS